MNASAQRAILIVASAGCALTVLDTNVVGVVLPTIARDLHASFADIEWVISGYVLCFASLLLPAGAIADRYGRKRVFLLGLSLFGLSSVACGLAPNAPLLYLARGAQGIGAAFQLAPALAIIGHAFTEPKLRAKAWAVWGTVMGLTMVLSPLIGGLINRYVGWPWAFHINAPICFLLGLAVLPIVPESRDPVPRTLDLPGMLLFASAMFCLTWALIGGPADGWASHAVLLRLAAGIALAATFIVVERHRAHPMLDLSLFRGTAFVGSVLAMFAYAAAAQVMASLLPLFLQNARGDDALGAGVGMLPFALAMLVFPHVGRRLGHKLAAHEVLTLGLVVTAIGNAILVYAAAGGDTAWLITGMAVLGSGGGLLNGETQKAIMGTVPPDRAGMASGISTTARFAGILLGFATLGAALASGVRDAAKERFTRAGFVLPDTALDRLVVGDFQQARATLPHLPAATFDGLAHASYGSGFAHAFLVAAGVAAAAALAVYECMKRRGG